MTKLVELSSNEHKKLNVIPSAIIEYASKQHVLPVSAVEIAHAATCFPVFMSRNKVDGGWSFSAMTGFLLNQNLFVEKGAWQPVYQPSALRTYPLYLMKSPKDSEKFTVGFDPQNSAFSLSEGKELFVAEGKPSEHLAAVTKLLENELQHMQASFHFANTLENLGLLKAIDLKVIYVNEQYSTIQGLHTIDEDKFKTLPAETLAQLNEQGYLMPIHAMLMSIYQLNVLINKNNEHTGNVPISTVKMEVTKAFSHH